MPDEARRRLRWELVILAGMYVGYMGFILCRTAIYVVSPAMVEDPALGLSKTMFGAILGWGTAGMVTGKLLSGAVADKLGGRRVFLLALSTTAASAAAFGVAGRFGLFSISRCSWRRPLAGPPCPSSSRPGTSRTATARCGASSRRARG